MNAFIASAAIVKAVAARSHCKSLLTAQCGGLPNVRHARAVQFAGIGQPRHCIAPTSTPARNPGGSTRTSHPLTPAGQARALVKGHACRVVMHAVRSS
jgi:hypothetical protein